MGMNIMDGWMDMTSCRHVQDQDYQHATNIRLANTTTAYVFLACVLPIVSGSGFQFDVCVADMLFSDRYIMC
jgi:hypothetical protein